MAPYLCSVAGLDRKFDPSSFLRSIGIIITTTTTIIMIMMTMMMMMIIIIITLTS